MSLETRQCVKDTKTIGANLDMGEMGGKEGSRLLILHVSDDTHMTSLIDMTILPERQFHRGRSACATGALSHHGTT